MGGGVLRKHSIAFGGSRGSLLVPIWAALNKAFEIFRRMQDALNLLIEAKAI